MGCSSCFSIFLFIIIRIMVFLLLMDNYGLGNKISSKLDLPDAIKSNNESSIDTTVIMPDHKNIHCLTTNQSNEHVSNHSEKHRPRIHGIRISVGMARDSNEESQENIEIINHENKQGKGFDIQADISFVVSKGKESDGLDRNQTNNQSEDDDIDIPIYQGHVRGRKKDVPVPPRKYWYPYYGRETYYTESPPVEQDFQNPHVYYVRIPLMWTTERSRKHYEGFTGGYGTNR